MKLENFKDPYGNYKKYVTQGSKRLWTMSGQTWNAMRARCKEDGCVQQAFPNLHWLRDVCQFLELQFLCRMARKQIGFRNEIYQLDKDLLIPKNKIYSEDTCVLLPAALNSFVMNTESKRTELPQGVVLVPENGRYKTQLRIDGKPNMLESMLQLKKRLKLTKQPKRTKLNAGIIG